jgi:hypothetical protein
VAKILGLLDGANDDLCRDGAAIRGAARRVGAGIAADAGERAVQAGR